MAKHNYKWEIRTASGGTYNSGNTGTRSGVEAVIESTKWIPGAVAVLLLRTDTRQDIVAWYLVNDGRFYKGTYDSAATINPSPEAEILGQLFTDRNGYPIE